MIDPMKDADFGFSCGSFGGARTSDDGMVIPIAKTEPFTPAMNPHAPIPSGGGRFTVRVIESGTITLKTDAVVGWVKHNPTGALWLALKPVDGGDPLELAQALQAFAGKTINLTFKLAR